MKKILLITALLIGITCSSQYHIRVQPNPDNRGEVNPQWMNNYVIAYTSDNWHSLVLLNTNLVWHGYDDNGKEYRTSTYEKITFKKLPDAIQLAKQLTTLKRVRLYEEGCYKLHLIRKKQYEEANKKLTFNSGDRLTRKETSAVNVY